MALNYLGKSISKNRLIHEFGQGERFKTYPHGRNASFNTNCNVLMALTSSPIEAEKYAIQIERVIKFLS